MLTRPYNFPRRKFLLAVYAVALFCRVILVLIHGQIHSIENYEPLIIGKNIAEGNGFSLHWPYVPFDEHRWQLMNTTVAPAYGTTFIPPLVPYFYAGFIKIMGLSQNALLVLMLIQAFVGAFLPILVFKATQNFFNENAARWSAIVSFLYLPAAMTATTFSGAVFYPLAGLGMIYYLGKLWKQGSVFSSVGVGVMAGVLSLMRSEFYYMFFALITITLVIWYKSYNYKYIAKYVSITVIAFLLTTGWWGIRNYAEFGRFIPVTGHPWREMWRGYNPYASGSGAGKNGFRIWENKKEYAHITKALDSIPFDNTFEEKADKIYKREVVQYVKNHTTDAVWLAVKKVIMFWSIDVYYEKAKHPLYILPQILTSILMFMGAYYTFRENKKTMLPWIIMFVCYSGVFALTYVLPRYQSYVFPLFFPLAGVALFKIVERKKIRE